MNYAKLEKSICDTIKEGQIKIGYSEEAVGLYYPMESIAELLEIDGSTKELTISKMQQYLAEFKRMCSANLGEVEISNKEKRFCFKIPKEGTKYVDEQYADNQFLRDFISNITKPTVTVQEILSVFYAYADVEQVHLEENSELGYVVYFEDETIDEYVYCLKFDEFGATYHRFTRLDYQKLS